MMVERWQKSMKCCSKIAYFGHSWGKTIPFSLKCLLSIEFLTFSWPTPGIPDLFQAWKKKSQIALFFKISLPCENPEKGNLLKLCTYQYYVFYLHTPPHLLWWLPFLFADNRFLKERINKRTLKYQAIIKHWCTMYSILLNNPILFGHISSKPIVPSGNTHFNLHVFNTSQW